MGLTTRFWIVVMIFFTTYINYTTRVNMSISIISMVQPKTKTVLIPECKRTDGNVTEQATNETKPVQYHGERYEWDERIQGIILGSYFYGYVITSFPGGLVAEWIGPFRTIFWSQVIALIANTVSVFAAYWHWGILCALRAILGLLAGFIYPALQVLIAQWAPPNEKGKFFGALLGNTFGTFLTWILVGYITEKTQWEYGFYFVSAQIALFCVAFWFLVSDTPATHRWISDEERNYIESSIGGTVKLEKRIPPYVKILTSCRVWAVTCAHWGSDWGLYVQLTGVPKYLAEVLGFSLTSSGALGALPHITRFVCGNIFGFVVDKLMKKELMSKTFLRKLFTLFSHIIPGTLLLLITLFGCSHLYIIIFLLILSMGFNGAAAVTNLVNPQDLAPNFAGTIYGFMNFLGGCTGFLGASVTSFLIKDNNGIKEWAWVFVIGGAMYIGTATVFILFGTAELQSFN